MIDFFAVAATIWPLVQHFGIGGIGMVAGFLFWRFSPVGKKVGLITAVVAGVVTGGYAIGVNDGSTQVRAQLDVQLSSLNRQIAAAQRDAEQSIPLVPDAVAPSPVPATGGVRHSVRPRPHKPLDKFDRG